MRWKKIFPEHLRVIWGCQSISPPEFEDQGCAGRSKIWGDALEKIFSRASPLPKFRPQDALALASALQSNRDVPVIFLRCAGFEMRWFLVIFKVVIESQVLLKARKPPSRLACQLAG